MLAPQHKAPRLPALLVRAALMLVVMCLPAPRALRADASPWQVPGDAEELRRACSGRPGLEGFGQNPYLGIECGYQAALLGSKLPLGPAAHVPWAKPYARGPIKLLIVTSFGNGPADVEQLAQVGRELDADVRWLLVAGMGTTAAETADYAYRTQYLPEQARAVLREDFDAIVMTFGTVRPGYGVQPAYGYFPDDVYAAILDKVRNGTGLLVVGQNVSGFWIDHTPLAAALPARMTSEHVKLQPAESRLDTPVDAAFQGVDFTAAWLTPWIVYGWQLRPDAHVLARVAGRPVIMAREHGRGRVVLLGWDGTLGPERSGARSELEHATALGLRAIAYAARKEPELRVELTHERLAAGQPGQLIARFSEAARLELTLRDEAFHSVHALTVQARAGQTAIRLPSLASGQYFLQVIARDAQGRVLNWGDQRLPVQAPFELSLTTDKEIYRAEDVVHVTVHGAGLPAGPELRASWQVRDASGRVLAREERPLSAGERFEFVIHAPRVAPHKVTLELKRGDVPLARATARFFVPGSRWDDYEVVLWGDKLNTQLRDEGGFTAVFDGYGVDARSNAAAHYGLHVARLGDGGLQPALVQTQPSRARADRAALLQGGIAAARRHGALFWLLQDERGQQSEPGMPDSEGLARFRSYLRAQYASLDALNASWGTHHTQWAQIEPVLTNNLLAGTKNLAPWVDFRLYVADLAFQMDVEQAHAVRAALGDDTPVGLDAFTTSGQVLPFGALDFGRLAAEGVYNFYAPYADDFILASLIKGPRAKYVGWSMPRAEYFGAPWRDALRGDWGSLRFFGPTFWSDFGFLQPAGRWTGESTRELRAGIGKLLIGSRRELSPVVLLYSYASLLTGSAARHWEPRHGGEALVSAAAVSRGVLEQQLLDAGVSFGYQTDTQVAHGGLAGKKLLILPRQMSLALSRATVQAIEQFVREGGTVLADLAPALCDEHGKPRATGGLDALFGVQTALESITHPAAEYAAAVQVQHPLVPRGEWMIDEWYDQRLRVTDGKPLGHHVADGTPAFVAKASGRGQSLLLNLLLASRWPSKPGTTADQRALMQSVLQAVGIEPLARVQAADGSPQAHCEINRFRDGKSEYYGFYAHAEPEVDAAQVRARFAQERDTYDVRTGTYLGRVREVPLTLHQREAALFARLDYRLTSVALVAPPSAARGQLLRIPIQVGASSTPGRHVLHVEVKAPDGAPLPLYTQNVVSEGGSAELQLVPALNDPPGLWQITAREVVSRLVGSASLELR